MSTNRKPDNVLRDRGISKVVQNARGYVPYYGKHHKDYDPEALRKLLERYPLAADQIKTLMKFAAEARDAAPPTDTFLRFEDEKPTKRRQPDGHDGRGQGLVMLKYAALPGDAPVFPQLRPEFAVRTGGVTWHRHDKDFEDDPVGLEDHVRDEHAGDYSFRSDRAHAHDDYAKYLVAPEAKERYSHDHATDPLFQGKRGRQNLIAHLRSHRHGHGVEKELKRRPLEGLHRLVQGEHPLDQPHHRDGMQTHRRPIRGLRSVANRIEGNPLALEALADADVIGFMLEGTPKADAILTHVRKRRLPWSVVDTVSVTTWKAKELEDFAKRYLLTNRNGETPLVPLFFDADWINNPAVRRQGLLARARLRKLEVRAILVAPPDDRYTHGKHKGELRWKGEDDFLYNGGAYDKKLEQNKVVVREVDRSVPKDLRELALHAERDEDGVETGRISLAIGSLEPMVRKANGAENTCAKLQEMVDAGLLTVEGDVKLELVDDEYTGNKCWKEKPVFIVPEHLRATQELVDLGSYEWPTPTLWERFSDPQTPAERSIALRFRAMALGVELDSGRPSEILKEKGSSRSTLYKDDEVKRMRELEHAVEVAQVHLSHSRGLSNRAIATELRISPTTVAKRLEETPDLLSTEGEPLIEDEGFPPFMAPGEPYRVPPLYGVLDELMGYLDFAREHTTKHDSDLKNDDNPNKEHPDVTQAQAEQLDRKLDDIKAQNAALAEKVDGLARRLGANPTDEEVTAAVDEFIESVHAT